MLGASFGSPLLRLQSVDLVPEGLEVLLLLRVRQLIPLRVGQQVEILAAFSVAALAQRLLEVVFLAIVADALAAPTTVSKPPP